MTSIGTDIDTRADPTADAAALVGYVPVSLGQRVAAWLLNGLINAVVIGVAFGALVIGSAGGFAAVLLALFIGELVFIGILAATPGGALLGLRNVDVRTGTTAGGRALLKYLYEALLSIVFLLGVILAVVTIRQPLNRNLFDRWSGVMVVDSRRGRRPRTPRDCADPASAATTPAPDAERNLIVPVGAPPAPPPLATERPPAGVSSSAPRPSDAGAGSIPAAMIVQVPGREVPGRPAPALPAGPAVPAGPVGAADAGDVDDHTSIAPQLAHLSTLRIVLDGGRSRAVDGLLLIGRDPSVRPGYEGAALVPINDPDFSVSKTHLMLSPGDGVIALRDLNSTNGTSFQVPGGTWTPAAAGVEHLIGAGTIVRFGNRTFEVER